MIKASSTDISWKTPPRDFTNGFIISIFMKDTSPGSAMHPQLCLRSASLGAARWRCGESISEVEHALLGLT